MHTKLFAIGALTALCCSGCATTLRSDETVRAYYETPVVEESVVVADSSPLVVDSSPIVVVERTQTTPFFPLLISYHTHGYGHHGPNFHRPPAPARPVGPGYGHSVKPGSGHGHDAKPGPGHGHSGNPGAGHGAVQPPVSNKPQPKWPGGYGGQSGKSGGSWNKAMFPPKTPPNMPTKHVATPMNNNQSGAAQHTSSTGSHLGAGGNRGFGHGSHFGGGGNHGTSQGSHFGGAGNRGAGHGSHFGGTTNHGGVHGGHGGHGGPGNHK